MDLKQLESFVMIADSGSFSLAAAAMNVAQPSLSRQMALLEADLGQRLLVRTGRGAATTPAGDALLTHARAMLESARRAREELRDMQTSPGGRVMVGMPPRVALGLSVPLVRAFRDQFPKAIITIVEGLSVSLRESLISGRLDLALLFDPLPAPQIGYEALLHESLLLVAPPGSHLPSRASLTSLANYPMVLPNPPNAIRRVVDQALQPRGIELEILAEVGAVQTVLALVMTGIGCTILPESALALSTEAMRLPRVPIGPPPLRNTLMLAVPLTRPATRLTSETQRLLRELDFRKDLALRR